MLRSSLVLFVPFVPGTVRTSGTSLTVAGCATLHSTVALPQHVIQLFPFIFLLFNPNPFHFMKRLPFNCQVQRLRLQNKSIRAISRKLGVSRYRVGKALHELERNQQNERLQALEDKLVACELVLRVLGYAPVNHNAMSRIGAYIRKSEAAKASLQRPSKYPKTYRRLAHAAILERHRGVATDVLYVQQQLLQRSSNND